MKKLIASLVLVLASTANAQIDCPINSVIDAAYDNEVGVVGLTYTDEDSDYVHVDIGAQTGGAFITIGKFTFEPDHDDILKTYGSRYTKYQFDAPQLEAKVQIRKYKSKKGIVLLKEKSKKWAPLLTFDCNEYEEEKKILRKSSVGHDNVKYVKLSRAHKAVRESKAGVLIDVELGDGYYNVVREKLFKVMNRSGKTIGYILKSYYTYTEGDDGVAYSKFLVNGIRTEGPVEN